MKIIHITIITVCFLAIFFVAVASPQEINDDSLLSLTVSEVINKVNLTFDEYFVIDEPPCVPRGIRGKAQDGQIIEIYIKRGDVPFSEKRDWELSEFLSKKVIGIARNKSNKWHITGEVMAIRAMTGESSKKITEPGVSH